ncbi:MAG: glucosamine-6-phosphate deaminase [Ruminococcaceae bacterium]|mgnify:CR=1 FL=1|nr:glucosamine-6-phosphate deaminase [Oscillospiraceae bacterium]
MKVILAKDYADMSNIAADIIEDVIKAKPSCTIGLATGSSPVGMYQELSRRCREENLDFSKIHTINLDEYVGLEPNHDQSYRHFMDENFFNHINIDKSNTFVAKGVGDPEKNLKEFNDILDKNEIEIQVLGIGPDGHLGFNEPGDVLYDKAHQEHLDESTISANARFFKNREDVPKYAFTMGMGDIMRAKRLLLLIGGNKAEAATKLLMTNTLDPHCPATFIRMHRNATVIIEQSLADVIGYKG